MGFFNMSFTATLFYDILDKLEAPTLEVEHLGEKDATEGNIYLNFEKGDVCALMAEGWDENIRHDKRLLIYSANPGSPPFHWGEMLSMYQRWLSDYMHDKRVKSHREGGKK